ncbi:MAG: sigma-E processing peptidase SpoIIGA [Clostridia bacterium]|nr:sigma-E processing peptidase SpoIIGA [Clostridia bacterium]
MEGIDVYVDVLFLINLGMDALCLTLTARILHRKIPMLRLWLAAASGGIYGVAALFLDVAPPMTWLADIALCVLMCWISMGKTRLLLTAGVYFLSSAVMGGAMTALYSFFNRMGVASLLQNGEDEGSVWVLGLLAGLGWLLTLIWGRVFRRSEAKRATDVDITVCLGSREAVLRGMIDSGNLLTDPIGGSPVIPVRRESVTEMLSLELQNALCETPFRTEALLSLPEASRLRLIPTETATGSGLLVAILPDAIYIGKKKEKRRIRALIAPIPLAGTEAEAVVPASLF